MKQLLLLLTTLMLMTSCLEQDDFYYSEQYWGDGADFRPIDKDDKALCLGWVGEWTTNVNATSSLFEIPSFPEDSLLQYLPGAKVYSETQVPVIRETIPYTHEDYEDRWQDDVTFTMQVKKHLMEFDVKANDQIRHVAVQMADAPGKVYKTSGTRKYWRYEFTLKAVWMTVDGTRVQDFKPIDYPTHILYNRLTDSRAH